MKKETLIKRAESLFGKIPPPVFKDETTNQAYRVVHELDKKINVTWVVEEAFDFIHDIELPNNWLKLTRYEKAAYIIDNSEGCREMFKRYWYKK